jgi:hypothetical protein
MARARRSGIVVTPGIVPLFLAMVARGDRRHDVGAWFGLNQGRVREVERGDYGLPALAPANQLPPSGSPGPRARDLRRAADRVEQLFVQGNAPQALAELRQAIATFDIPV